jgi:hypothetical protein
MQDNPIEEVLKHHTGSLMKIPGVVGTGQGLCEDQPCIKIFVATLTPELQAKIPTRLDGYPVVIENTGTFKSLPEDG